MATDKGNGPSQATVEEGFLTRDVPGVEQPCRTWYQMHKPTSTDGKSRTPVIILHGGPGASHEYLADHVRLATSEFAIPTIMYDQLGCGKSTRLPDKAGNREFWTEELFLTELDALVDHLDLRKNGFDVLGHSWGAMMAAAYAARRPPGLKQVVLSGAPPSMPDWAEAGRRLRLDLSPEHQEALERCEAVDDHEAPEYEAACAEFFKRHMCRTEPWPHPAFQSAIGNMMGDSTVYGTMVGYSEVKVIGNLRDWTVKDRIHNIDVPTLVIHGEHDNAQEYTQQVFMDKIPRIHWVTMRGASHFAHVERPDDYYRQLGAFLVDRQCPAGTHTYVEMDGKLTTA